jgi:hypothetical protein
MVMPLDMLRDGGFAVDPAQRKARVLLTGLLGLQEVRVIGSRDAFIDGVG